MNTYIAALTIGIGLMAHSSAFAEILKFGPMNGVPMEECLEAAKQGFELSEGKISNQRFLIKDIKMGTSWRVYEIHTIKGAGRFDVSCIYRSLNARTT